MRLGWHREMDLEYLRVEVVLLIWDNVKGIDASYFLPRIPRHLTAHGRSAVTPALNHFRAKALPNSGTYGYRLQCTETSTVRAFGVHRMGSDVKAKARRHKFSRGDGSRCELGQLSIFFCFLCFKSDTFEGTCYVLGVEKHSMKPLCLHFQL